MIGHININEVVQSLLDSCRRNHDVDHSKKRNAKVKLERVIDSCKTVEQMKASVDMIDMFQKKFCDEYDTADLKERMNVKLEKMCLVF